MFVLQEEAATVLTPVKKKIKNVAIFLKVRLAICFVFILINYTDLKPFERFLTSLHRSLSGWQCYRRMFVLQNDDEEDEEEDGDDAEELLGKGARSAALLADRTRVSVGVSLLCVI